MLEIPCVPNEWKREECTGTGKKRFNDTKGPVV